MLRYGKAYSRQLNCEIKQLTLKQARLQYDDGKDIFLLPCNMSLDNVWMPMCSVSKSSGEEFERVVNAFAYYNCDNWRGRRPMYFIRQSDYSPRSARRKTKSTETINNF